jgi:hypothetical protein
MAVRQKQNKKYKTINLSKNRLNFVIVKKIFFLKFLESEITVI